MRWQDLPPQVRAGVAEVLGSAVVRAVSQPGGFSPGSADRVVTASGRRAFVKAVSPAQNEHSPALHRREAAVAAALPAAVPAPRLLGSVDDGDWIVLVLDEVDGRHPHLPWTAGDLGLVLDALTGLARSATPCPVAGLPGAADALAADLPAEVLPLLAGDTLAHSDLRADNLLVTASGAVLLDWPHACRGPAWLDTLLLLVEVDRFGGHDVDRLLATAPTTRDVDPGVLTAVLAGFEHYFRTSAAAPPPPGLPTLREFQRVQGEALAAWVRRRGR